MFSPLQATHFPQHGSGLPPQDPAFGHRNHEFVVTNSFTAFNKYEFVATNSFPALNRHEFGVTNSLPALNRYEFCATNSLPALDNYKFGATNSFPTLDRRKFAVTNSFSALKKYKFGATNTSAQVAAEQNSKGLMIKARTDGADFYHVKFPLETCIFNAHSHCVANVRKNVNKKVATFLLTFYRSFL